jgi:SAM-dependent methyltransferase
MPARDLVRRAVVFLDQRRQARWRESAARDEPPAVFSINPANFDSALRVAEVVDLLRGHFRPEVKILEVGSGSAGVTTFLKFPVTGVDTAFERTADIATPYLMPVAASAAALPFEDGSFDIVLSLEMLEHLPAEIRRDALSEMYRALKPGGRMVVTFPADESAAKLDRKLNDAFQRRHGQDHPWSIEHIREGVPATPEVVATMEQITAGGATVAVRKHDPGWSWLLHQTLYSVRRWPWLTLLLGIQTRRGAALLWRLLRRAPGGNHYRTILVVDKTA